MHANVDRSTGPVNLSYHTWWEHRGGGVLMDSTCRHSPFFVVRCGARACACAKLGGVKVRVVHTYVYDDDRHSGR